MNNRGVALAIAVTVSLMISLLAAVVLNITFRRFNLSFFQQSRAIALYASEAGIQYVDTRLKTDTNSNPLTPGFRERVLTKSQSTTPPSWYIVSSYTVGKDQTNSSQDARNAGHLSIGETLDEWGIGALEMGGSIKKKEVTIKVRENPAGSGKFEVRVKADYGTGI